MEVANANQMLMDLFVMTACLDTIKQKTMHVLIVVAMKTGPLVGCFMVVKMEAENVLVNRTMINLQRTKNASIEILTMPIKMKMVGAVTATVIKLELVAKETVMMRVLAIAKGTIVYQ
jgi:hypothetical protein